MDNYESLALKHYTSKLSTYSDLNTLETFGFRGEALSSLCALSRFTVTTCLPSDVPKGTKLEFDTSGKLTGTSVVAAQKGTTMTVETLFQNLPVRRRELERNIKREWGKVITLLNQYACVQTGVKFTVSQQPNKGKRIVLFSTKGNRTTRENIVNVFGAKTMTALVALDLKLQLELTGGPNQKWTTQGDDRTQDVLILGFVSRPVHGEGRQTPDRQMFYVNSRPCGLPQFAKVFNEVYRSFNSSQSPFIFADIQLDTHLYDVNVSPDKRTILLHDQSRMLDNLRDALTELFEKQDYTVPVSLITPLKQTPFKKPTILRQQTIDEEPIPTTTPVSLSVSSHENEELPAALASDSEDPGLERIRNLAAAKALAREAHSSILTTRRTGTVENSQKEARAATEKHTSPTAESHLLDGAEVQFVSDERHETVSQEHKFDKVETNLGSVFSDEINNQENDFFTQLAKMKRSFLPDSLQDEVMEDGKPDEPPIPAIAKSVKPSDNAPLSVSATRPSKRPSQEVATITIGDDTVTGIIGVEPKRPRRDEATADKRGSQKRFDRPKTPAALPSFGGRLTQMFAAATARQEQPADDDDGDLDADSDNAGGSQDRSDSASELDIESAEEAHTASDVDDDDAKSSPLFVDQDEVEQSPISPLDNKTQGIDDIDENMDVDYVDEAENDAMKEATAESMPEVAEGPDHEPREENQKRTQAFLKGGTKGKYSTQSLLQRVKVDEDLLDRRLQQWKRQLGRLEAPHSLEQAEGADDGLKGVGLEAENAEEKLALAIHKGDFGKMKIVGQFNLGFILAVRPSNGSGSPNDNDNDDDDDELFIIDQHASDEKYNFERLQSTTAVQSQRLVRPKPLELTAVEEEIVIENQAALEKNGFIVAVDESGDEPVGSRCQLLSLPLSRETTFSLADLEELISLLGDNPTTVTNSAPENRDNNKSSCCSSSNNNNSSRYIPRPSKVRKMFAMRACRCSIMIGKALSHRQMETVVRHMGGMEKPWNCPHGRPTMRHLCGLGSAWDQQGWKEGDSGEEYATENKRSTDWAGYVRQNRT